MDDTGFNNDLLIRKYNEETDYEDVFFIESYRHKEPYTISVFLRQAAFLHHSTFLVAEKNNKIAGFTIGAFVHEKPGNAWIIRMVVHPEFRQQGIGKKLFGALLSCLTKNGATEILLTVSPDNLPARKIYRHHGFRTVEERKDYFGTGEDRLIKVFHVNKDEGPIRD